MKFVGDINKLISGYWAGVVKVVVLVILFELVRVATSRFYGRLVDEISAQASVTYLLILPWFLGSVLGWMFNGLTDFQVLRLLVNLEFKLPVQVLKHMLLLSMSFFDNIGTGKLAKRIEKGVDGMVGLVEYFSWEVVGSSLQYVVTFAYLGFMYKPWGLILLALLPAFAVMSLVLNNFKRPLRKKRHDLYEDSSHLLVQIMQNISLVKAYAQEETEFARYRDIRESIRNTSHKEFGTEILFNIVRGLLVTITLIAVFFVGSSAVSAGRVKLGDLVVAMNLSTAATLSLFRLTYIAIRFMDNYEAIQRVVAFLEEKPTVADLQEALEILDIAGDVSFVDVSYSHSRMDEGKGHGLYDVSFSVPAGSMVALVGPSGGGKTTLVNLILRFMDPDNGKVVVGGHDLRSLRQFSYRRLTALVAQEPALFDRPVGANVAFGIGEDWSDCDKDRIWESLDMAHASDFVRGLPGGLELETLVGERGVKLSGGQKQRLAIAMALARSPRILVLDEATSNLDTQNEQAIQKVLYEMKRRGGVTMFVIAHRLSTVRNADVILVLKEGRIVQMGDHKTLMAAKEGLYCKMVESQQVFE